MQGTAIASQLHTSGPCCEQVGFPVSGMHAPSATFASLSLLRQHSIHGAHRAAVTTLVQQRRIELAGALSAKRSLAICGSSTAPYRSAPMATGSRGGFVPGNLGVPRAPDRCARAFPFAAQPFIRRREVSRFILARGSLCQPL